MKISIVSPLYNEEDGAVAFINAVTEVLSSRWDFEIILVDDGSKDATWEILEKESLKRDYLKCIKLSRNFGKEAALTAGLSFARGDICITIDSDLQHPPYFIPEMVKYWEEGYNVVECVKEKRQKESIFSMVYAKLFYLMFKRFSGVDISGATDFKLMDANVVNAILKMPEKQVFFRGIAAWVGFKRKQIFFTPPDRKAGISKWPFMKRFNLAVTSLSSFTAKPLMIIWLMCIFFAGFSLFVGGEALYGYISGNAKDGFTTIILLILLTGSCVLFSISLISIYIAQIFHEVKQRPRYLIADTINKEETQ